jgi:Transposase IS66 family
MRKGIDGLAMLVQGVLRQDPFSGHQRDDRSWSGPDPPAAVYFYSTDRKAERPASHLEGFRGVLQVDGYFGFERLTMAWSQYLLTSTCANKAGVAIPLAMGRSDAGGRRFESDDKAWAAVSCWQPVGPTPAGSSTTCIRRPGHRSLLKPCAGLASFMQSRSPSGDKTLKSAGRTQRPVLKNKAGRTLLRVRACARESTQIR